MLLAEHVGCLRQLVFASANFEHGPLDLWEACKVTLFDQQDAPCSWDNFEQWCITTFCVHNHERNARSELQRLCQMGSVADYMAAHNVLAAKTTLPMQLRIHRREQGLEPEIASQVTVDPLTHKEYTDIEKAQSAA